MLYCWGWCGIMTLDESHDYIYFLLRKVSLWLCKSLENSGNFILLVCGSTLRQPSYAIYFHWLIVSVTLLWVHSGGGVSGWRGVVGRTADIIVEMPSPRAVLYAAAAAAASISTQPDTRLMLHALCCGHGHYTHPFNSPFSGTTQVSSYQKGKTSLDFTEAGDSEWQWHHLGRMQVCTSLQTDNHASTAPRHSCG